jgi:hypothetical protein
MKRRSQRLLLGTAFAMTAVVIGPLIVSGAKSADIGTLTTRPANGSDPIPAESTFLPAADSFSAPGTTLYKASGSLSLRVGGRPLALTLIQFTVPDLPGDVTHAKLDLYVRNRARTSIRAEAAYVPVQVEGRRAKIPALNDRSAAISGSVAANGWVSIDVTGLVRGKGLVTFVLTNPHGPRLDIASREVSYLAPKLSIDVVPVLLAAGDLSWCPESGEPPAAATLARILSGVAGIFAPLGDIVYASGTSSEFTYCFDQWFGPIKSRTRPTPGNHEYYTPDAAGYFGYYGGLAGDPARGYYSYDFGSWHVVVLSSNCADIGGCGPGSPQFAWLNEDLASHRTTCSLAYWHQPLFGSGPFGRTPEMVSLWRLLYDNGVDVVLNGHAHHYERFAPQNPAGAVDLTKGVREFIVGTGGRNHLSMDPLAANSEVRDATTFGYLSLKLRENSYEWQFVPVLDGTFTDAGAATCH